MPINLWNGAPSVLAEWTGRKDFISRISSDWNDPRKQVTSLIGFGGEGKSSLARKWVDTLLNDSSQPQPDGLFWWGFYENRSVDEFLEAALKYMSGGRIDPRDVPSSNLKAQIIGAMLSTGKYLFILDGLEVMQYQEGDQYGLVQSNDLRDLLTFFARPDNGPFCLITSRAPLLDLMDYTTYTHCDVERLSDEDGRALLRRLGVQGTDDELNKVVSDWDGHALTLGILAAYLAERFNGDIKHLAEIPIPTAGEPRYERVHRVLRRYDDHLTQEEREFLKLFSVFRLPVKEDAFEEVFEPLLKNVGVRSSPSGDIVVSLREIVNRLVTCRLIRYDEHENSYTAHPLIRNHYLTLFTKGDPSQGKAVHSQIKGYYLSLAGNKNKPFPSLEDLKPFIEVVHHACQSGAYDEAELFRWERIDQGQRHVLSHVLGANATQLSIMLEYFPNGDVTKEPQLKKNYDKSFVLNEIGLCLMKLGRLSEAVPFYKRAVENYILEKDWHNASTVNRNITVSYGHLGMLDASIEAAYQALDLARKEENKQDEIASLASQGFTNYLLGNIRVANNAFSRAEKLAQKDHSVMRNSLRTRYLHSLRSIQHANHLRRTGDLNYARRVTDANIQISEQEHWSDNISQCYRIFGDLNFDVGDYESTYKNYESALKIARSIQARDVFIEALLARGRFFAKHLKDANAAFSDLNEALGYCVESGYRIYEADVRVALSWACLANGEKEKAKASAERALQMSNEMGYHWGKVDAEEVLRKIKWKEFIQRWFG